MIALSQFSIFTLVCVCVGIVINMIIPLLPKYLKHSEDGTIYSKIMKILAMFNECKVASTLIIIIYTYLIVNIAFIIKKKLKKKEA